VKGAQEDVAEEAERQPRLGEVFRSAGGFGQPAGIPVHQVGHLLALHQTSPIRIEPICGGMRSMPYENGQRRMPNMRMNKARHMQQIAMRMPPVRVLILLINLLTPQVSESAKTGPATGADWTGIDLAAMGAGPPRKARA